MDLSTKRRYYFIIFILGMLTALIPFSVDMYLPGFPAIAKGLNCSVDQVGVSLAAFFIGICIGQLFYGPLMDRFGRKKPLIAGLSIYVAAAIGCTYSSGMDELARFRLLQALGGCAAMVASRAAVRDLFPLNESAKVFSMLMLIMGVAPIIAPTVGSFIVMAFNWQAIFFTLASIGVFLILLSLFFLPESKGPDPSISLNPIKILSEYASVIKNKNFVSYTLILAFTSATLFAYITGSPFIFMNLLNFNEQEYGLVFGFNAACLILGSQLNRLLLRWKSSAWITGAAGLGLFITAFLLLTASLSKLESFPVLLTCISLQLFLTGFVFPNASALALHPFSKNAGMAAALSGVFQMGFSALSAFSLSQFANGSSVPMAFIIFASSAASLICLWRVRSYRHRNSVVDIRV